MDTLIMHGGAVKALNEQGLVGGYLVRFSSADAPDLAGDFFTPNTDFDLEGKTSLRALYHHGLDPVLKRTPIGRTVFKTDDVGIWAETQLNLADAYQQKIWELTKAGKLGYSSGATA